MSQDLIVRGARQHNLKAVDCVLPRNRLVVITGPSGSGKSSLAFDTIYAEGQRRYVESLSAYARQFLEQLPKPDVDSIEGLSPAVAIEQRGLGKNPRSTVGTVTEIADYLRLLFARAGTPHCPVSGQVLRAYTVQEIVDSLLARPDGSKLLLLAPVFRQSRDDVPAELERLRRDGFVRARLDGTVIELGDEPDVDPNALHDLDVVVDRLVVRPNAKGRITDSVELALEVGNRTLLVDQLDGSEPIVMSERLVSWEHGVTLPPLEPRLFSFNSPHGACPACEGLGLRSRVDPGRVVPDRSRTLREGAIVAFGARGSEATAAEVHEAAEVLGVEVDTPFDALPDAQQQALLFGRDGDARRKLAPYPGIIARLERLLHDESAELDNESLEGALDREDLGRFVVEQACEACRGARLRPEALAVRIGGNNIAELCALSLAELRNLLSGLLEKKLFEGASLAVAESLISRINERLGFLINVGLDYLTLDRATSTLSGGEGQRIRLATQIGAALSGVLYVLDEPSVGLHPRDNARLLEALRKLVDKGNSVIVVEHDRDAILSADHVVDLGPGAGQHGGEIVAQGTPLEVMADPRSVTGPYLKANTALGRSESRKKAEPSRVVKIIGARAHNLKNVTAEIPLGLLTVVTGVSGSGKSSLIVDTLLSAARSKFYGASTAIGPCQRIAGLDELDKVVSIDQAPIGRTPRSNPATYTGIFTLLRELMATLPEARARGYKPGRFSFNVKGGRCETCQGDGLRRVEMHFLPDVYVKCSACGGRRYNRETLEIRFRGHSIAELCDMTVEQASSLFSSIPRLKQRLDALSRVGLGYIKLGQAATTLSGGEAQRVKLATELARTATGKTLYVLDEPTSGLHFTDIELLATALLELRDAGNTVVVIEHNLDLISLADWVVDMGPDGGVRGGEIVAQGTPEQIAADHQSHTGECLRALELAPPSSRAKATSKPRRSEGRARSAAS